MKSYVMVFLTGLMLAIFLVGCGNGGEEEAGEDDVFEIAIIPAQSIGEMQAGLDKLEEELTEKLDRSVAIEHYPNYNAVVEAINYGHTDLAYLGPLTYVIAHERSGAQAILTQLVNGEPYYYSYIVTHADAKWNSLEELLEDKAEVDFAFGSISSTSGSLMPGLELKQRGVFESEDVHEFKSVRYTGSHDITAQQVQNKHVDAGAIDSAIFNGLIADGAIDGDQVKKIWQSEQLYQYPWVVPGTTDEETIQQIQDAFVSISDPEILTIFGGASAFVTASDEKYQDVLEAAREFGMLDQD